MPATTNDVASRIINSLYLSDPELDTSIGTPLRKIIDAVSEQIAQSSSDTFLLDYSYDVDSKTGGDLDDFVANFGLSRLQGQRANGVVTFSRSAATAALKAAVIPPGTQVASLSVPPVYVATTVSGTLALNQTGVDVPVQAIVAGPSGNLLAGSLNTVVSPIDGISYSTNANPLTGGTNAETDDQLRQRFKTTALRNLSGTDSMFRGIALQTLANPADPTSNAVSQVNILGTTKHWAEQIQVVNGSAVSAIAVSSYSYANSVFVGPSLAGGSVVSQNGNYTVIVNNTSSPVVQSTGSVPGFPTGTDGTYNVTIPAYSLAIFTVATGLPDGIYDLEFDYVPTSSRNDPFGSRWSQGVVNNRVDVWVNGNQSAAAIQAVFFVNTIKFNNTANDPLLRTRFVTLTGTNPSLNDVFVPLAFGPIWSLTLSADGTGPYIQIGAVKYYQGTDFDIVHQDDAFGYSPQSAFGLVWYMGSTKNTSTPPANNSTFNLNYNYNQVPTLVATNIANWRLVGTDVQVHAGKLQNVQFNFYVMYLPNYSPTSVNTNITTVLSNFINGLGFDSALQVSDVLSVVSDVPGVDNIRMTDSFDTATPLTQDGVYGIQFLLPNGTMPTGGNKSRAIVSGGSTVGYRPTDFYFDDRSYPVLYNVNYTTKARNSFRP